MSTYLGYTPAWLESHNALHTARKSANNRGYGAS